MMAKNMPPMIMGKPATLITKDFQWGSVAATPPPNVTVKAVVQSTDAASAKSTHELIVSAMLMNQKTQSKLPDDLITLLTPQVQGSQLVTSLDTKDIKQAAVAMKEPLGRARQVALRVRSASNIRQILQVCMLHSNDNKGVWPADMKELEKSMAKFGGPNSKQVLTNPQKPTVQPAYVYIKPAKKQPDPQTVVVYESHKDFGDGINVGFADGHVEWVSQKQQFDQMLAKTAQDQ
jgi:prepilin-type processing-associated H-X9-DG protein